jgi:hypothetical protein
MSDYSQEDFDDARDDVKQSVAQIEPTRDLKLEDKIIDAAIAGDCMDTIKRKLKITYAEVEEVLLDAGMI